jgi:protein-disulfide isomerase
MDIHEAQKEIPKHTESKATITIKKDHFLIGLAIALLVVGFAAGYFYHNFTGAGGGTPSPTPTVNETARVFVSAGSNALLGKSDAPVTIIEFSDYQCPYCERAATQIEPQIKTDYIDTGKVKFAFRNFPLGMHANAQPAAIAAECASEQGKYWEFHDALFANQSSWSQSNDSSTAFKNLATKLNLDIGKWNSCLNDTKIAEEISKDISDGTTAGVQGTPTYFIGNDKNGYVMLVGAQPYDAFKQAIDAELAK